MNIEVENYILKSDGLSMWIEQKYIGKSKDGKDKEYVKRVTGYLPTFQMLFQSFVQRKVKGSEAADMQEILKDLAEVEKELHILAEGIGKGIDEKVK